MIGRAEIFQPPNGLAECEQVIEQGLKSFTEVGIALMTIRDGRLYRDSYPTFEAYCEHRWGFTRQRAHQLISSSEVTRAVSSMLDTAPPANERQAAELRGLPPETAAEVMTEAATAGKVTALSIREARERLAPEPESTEAESPAPPALDRVTIRRKIWADLTKVRRWDLAVLVTTLEDDDITMINDLITDLQRLIDKAVARRHKRMAKQGDSA
jgi:hypothetical protein